MRVHELAKELDLSSKDLLSELEEIGVEVKNHMSALDDEQVDFIQKELGIQIASATETPDKPAKSEAAEETDSEPQAEEEASEEDAADSPGEAAEEAPEKEPEPEGPKIITLKGPVIVREYAEMLDLRPNQLIAQLMGMNIFASISEKIDPKVAKQLAEKNGFLFQAEKKPAAKKAPPPKPKKEKVPVAAVDSKAEPRPPVVTFMGHVDHGKTSLLDFVRKSRVTAGESGGITQHIGAYTVEHKGHKITFLDTPGHAAFTAMRARGANLTDIAVLVVAADDGLMPQTREAIQHAQAAGVTILVAINKIDLPGANPDRVKQQLQAEGLTPEDWGGELVCCNVSAITGEGMDDFLEMLGLQAEMLELQAPSKGPAEGYIIEAQLETGRGATATVLIRKGELKAGDFLVCGTCHGKIKAMYDDAGKPVKKVGPSGAVKILGLNEVPAAGGAFHVASNEREAKREIQELLEQERQDKLATPERPTTLESLFSAKTEEEKSELALVIKSDVQGSLEAIIHSLNEIKSDKVSINYVLTGVGNISPNDVLLAKASSAIILGFHVAKDNGASAASKKEGVEIRLYSIIYELIDDVKAAMTGLLAPTYEEKYLGQAEIKQVFDLTKKGRVAGCVVLNGVITSRAKARVLRGREVLYEGSVKTLRRFQNEASEVRHGQECGIGLDNFSDFTEGDIVEAYEVQEVAQKL